MNTIKVSGTGDTDARVASLEQAVNYGEVILPFPVIDEVEGGGGTGGPPTGPASGDLSGTYPAPQIAAGVIVDADVNAAAGIQGTKLANAPNGIPTAKVNDGAVTRVKTAPDCWLSPIPVDPTDVTKVLTVAAGPTLVWQTPTVTEGLTGVWNYRVADGTGDPGTRNLSPDVAAAPTFLRFSKTETDGTDATNVLVTTGVGDVLIAQQRTDANKWSKLQVRAPIVDHGTWVEVPITVLATSGAGVPANNTDVMVQFQRGTGSTSYPPSGPAGGDLSGTYPNPQLAAGAIVDADVSATAAIQYSKLTGVPTSLPPSGAASGDLTGTYPGPTVAAGKITAVKLSPAPVAGDVGKMVTVAAGPALGYTAVPTSLPPSGAASGDLTGSYPAPTIAKLNGAAVGTTTPLARGDLLVADATPALKRLGLGAASEVLQSNGTDVVWGASLGGPPSGAAGGNLTGTYPNPTIASGAVTWAKTSLQMYARVGRTTSISVPNNTLVYVSFDVITTNVGGLFSAGAPDRFTIADAGFYVFGGHIGFEPAPTGVGIRRALLAVSGGMATFIDLVGGRWNGSAWVADYVRPSVTAGVFCTAGQYVQLGAFQDSGAAVTAGVTMTAVMWISRVS